MANSKSNVTAIRKAGEASTHNPAGVADHPSEHEATRAELLGDIGKVSDGPIEQVLEEQRRALWGAVAIVESIAEALEQRFGRDWPADVPQYPLALRSAAAAINGVTENLEAEVVEERALELARESREGGAA